MPNLRRPVLSAQVASFMDTPERAALIKAWVAHLNCTHGAIMRDVLDYGLTFMLDAYAQTNGELPAEMYDEALTAERARAAARTAAGIEAKRAERALPKKRKRAPRKAAA